MKLAKGYVYDYETVKNCFLGMFINLANPNDIISFEMSTYEDQSEDFHKFLNQVIKQKTTLVSYNGLKFDSQVSRSFLSAYGLMINTGTEWATHLFQKAQTIIKRANEREFPIHHPKDNPFKEIDILAINNYDNPAKRSSLKWLQYSMDWHNVEDMAKPFDQTHNEQDILLLRRYCMNDCLSTRELFFKNKSEILLRGNLTKHFGMDLTSASEPKLAKSIFLKLLAEQMDVPQYELKKKKTYRKEIKLSEVILPYIKFKTKVFQETLVEFKGKVLDGENLKGSFKKDVVYRGMPITFALGGIHGAKKGIYKSCKDFIIKSFDVKCCVITL